MTTQPRAIPSISPPTMAACMTIGRHSAPVLLCGLLVLGAGCAAFAPPIRGDSIAVAAPGGRTEATLHGLRVQGGAWQGDLRVPVRGQTDDVEIGVFGHKVPGDGIEGFTMASVGWRHREALSQALQLSAAAGGGLGVGGHGQGWPEGAIEWAAGGYLDVGLAYAVRDWVRPYAMARLQHSVGLSSPDDPNQADAVLPRAPSTTWATAALGLRLDFGPALIGVGWNWSSGFTPDDRFDFSGFTFSAGMGF